MSNEKGGGGRLTIVEHGYYQAPNESPTEIGAKFTVLLSSDEQPYSRRTKVAEEWKPIDCGWIECSSMFYIDNLEGVFNQQIPTDEVRNDAMQKGLELGVKAPNGDIVHFCSIAPSSGQRIAFREPSKIRIRSRSGEAKYQIHIFPE